MIKLPTNKSEFEIQSDLLNKLRATISRKKYIVRGEVFCRGKRLDIVIFRKTDKEPVLVIEVKKSINRLRTRKVSDKEINQIKNYQSFGVPVFLCCGFNHNKKAVEFINCLINNYKINSYCEDLNSYVFYPDTDIY